MARGENIFKRKDGRWEARYIKERELSGKIKYGFCYGRTYKEAKMKVEKCKVLVATGSSLPLVNAHHRFSFYCDKWLCLRKIDVKESTYIKYETTLERHIKPKLGMCFPLEITTVLIDNFTLELLHESHLSPKTIHDILSILHSILKYTAKSFAGTFPPIEINYPRIPKKEMRVLSRNEQELLTKYLLCNMDPCKFGLLLALFTGLRVGELCALQWGDISLVDNTIHISSTMQRIRNGNSNEKNKTKIAIGTAKSGSSTRIIPITNQIAVLCKQMASQDSADFILTGTNQYMEPRTLQYRLKKYTDECGLKGVHCHTLRHTFATRAVEVGFEVKSLSEILGHAATTITLERYVHPSIELKRINMEKMASTGF